MGEKTFNTLVLEITSGNKSLLERIIGKITNPGGEEKTLIKVRSGDDDEYQQLVVDEELRVGDYAITVSKDGNDFTFSEKNLAPVVSEDIQTALGGPISENLASLLTGDSAPSVQVFESVPSLLLSLNGLADLSPSREDQDSEGRMSTKGNSMGDRGANAWFAVEFGNGSWKAETSTYGSIASDSSNTEYDLKRQGFKAGIDIPTGDDFVVGVSLHHNRSTANFKNDAGSAKIKGQGLGVSGTYSTDSIYIGAQVATTKFKADLTGEVKQVHCFRSFGFRTFRGHRSGTSNSVERDNVHAAVRS